MGANTASDNALQNISGLAMRDYKQPIIDRYLHNTDQKKINLLWTSIIAIFGNLLLLIVYSFCSIILKNTVKQE